MLEQVTVRMNLNTSCDNIWMSAIPKKPLAFQSPTVLPVSFSFSLSLSLSFSFLELRASCLLGRYSNTEPLSKPSSISYLIQNQPQTQLLQDNKGLGGASSLVRQWLTILKSTVLGKNPGRLCCFAVWLKDCSLISLCLPFLVYKMKIKIEPGTSQGYLRIKQNDVWTEGTCYRVHYIVNSTHLSYCY
jgi:hypothetical protein